VASKKIVVLLHEKDGIFEKTTYLLRLMMERWRASGHAVEIVRGVGRFVPADLMIPHLDLTVTPEPYRDFMAQYPVVLNRRVLDVSKSKISSNLLRKGEDYDGPVIVKTERNYGGLPEARLKRERRPSPSFVRRILGSAISKIRPSRAGATEWNLVESMESGSYPVFPSLASVPAGVFGNPNLVVEKFLPEREGTDYCLRYYYFFRDREINFLLKSRNMVVKGSNAHRCDEVPSPPELHAIRQRLGIDFGKFDYVLRDGRVVLFDVNRTPSYSSLEPRGLSGPVADRLAEGIESLPEAADGTG